MTRTFENIPIFGYFSCYLYLEFADETVTVCEASMDFSKPLTQAVFDNIANTFKEYYEKQGKYVSAGKFITKELYDQINERLNGELLNISWDEEEIEVN